MIKRTRKCPDCGKELVWNEKFGMFTHKDSICSYMEDIFGNRIWDNKKKAEEIKNMGKE